MRTPQFVTYGLLKDKRLHILGIYKLLAQRCPEPENIDKYFGRPNSLVGPGFERPF